MLTYLRQLKRRVRNFYHLTNMIGKEDVKNKTIYWVVKIPYARMFYVDRVLNKATIQEVMHMIQYEEPFDFKVTVNYSPGNYETYTLNINMEGMAIHNGKTIVAREPGETVFITKDKYNAKRIIRETLEKRIKRINKPWNYKETTDIYKEVMKQLKNEHYVSKQ